MANAQVQAGGDQQPAMTTIAGVSMLVIIIALSVIIWDQHRDLKDAVKTLATVSAKCLKK